MQKTQQHHTHEFKIEAVQLVQSSGKPMSQMARDLGIADSTLYHGLLSPPMKFTTLSISRPIRKSGYLSQIRRNTLST